MPFEMHFRKGLRPAGYPRPAGRRLNSANAPFESRPLNRGVGWEASSRAAGRNWPKLDLTRGSSRKMAYPKVDRPFTPIPASAVLQA